MSDQRASVHCRDQTQLVKTELAQVCDGHKKGQRYFNGLYGSVCWFKKSDGNKLTERIAF